VIITLPDGTIHIYDAKGTLCVRMGNLDAESFMSKMAHLTLDGVYITSYVMDQNWYLPTKMQKLAATYEQHQAWCLSAGQWYTIPVAGLRFSRWDTTRTEDVPEMVRTAEILR
jgi:hypothetical protein